LIDLSVEGARETGFLGIDHVDDLAAAGDEIGQQAALRVGWRHGLDDGRDGEAGQHGGINRIGLGALAKGIGEGSHLGRVDHRHRQAGSLQGRCHQGLIATGCLQRHQPWRKLAEAIGQLDSASVIQWVPG
jgi:hypothetical protein